MSVKVRLEVHRDGQKIREDVISARKTMLGRGEGDGSSRVVLDDETVSFEHAQIQIRGEDVLIQDLRSRNKVLINGQIIDPGIFYRLRDGDVIEICAFALRVNILLPKKAPPPEEVPPTLGDFSLGLHFQPASVTAYDFTSYMTLPSGAKCIAVGNIEKQKDIREDTSQEAMEILRAEAVDAKGPASLLEKLNSRLLTELATENPISAVCGVLDPGKGTFRFASAGDIEPIFFNRQKASNLRLVPSDGKALNVSSAPLELAEKLVRFRPGDILLIPTAGVLKASFIPDHQETQQMRNLIREELIEAWGEKLGSFVERLKDRIQEVETRVGPFGLGGLRRVTQETAAQGLAAIIPAVSKALTEHLRGQAALQDQTLFGLEKAR